MPTYQVMCDTCNHTFTGRIHSIDSHVKDCEYCGNDVCPDCKDDWHQDCNNEDNSHEMDEIFNASNDELG